MSDNRPKCEILTAEALFVCRRQKVGSLTGLNALIVLLLAITMNIAPGIPGLRAEDALCAPMQLAQANQTPRKNPALEDSQMVKPTQKEREAIRQLLATHRPQQTLKNADKKYLKGLLDKAAWFGFERRIVHEMWTEMSGREWRDTEGP
jgi:hypothetical protein